MFNYGNPTAIRVSKSHYSPKRDFSLKRNDDYKKLRLKTIKFLQETPIDLKRFKKLEEAIRYRLLNDIVPSYSYANLLEVIYIHRLLNTSKSVTASFGARISHELDDDSSLEIVSLPNGLEMPDILRNGWKLNYMTIKISPLLHNSRLYKIINDPWEGDMDYIRGLYEDIVINFYNRNSAAFEEKNVYVHPHAYFYSKGLHIDTEGIRVNVLPKIRELQETNEPNKFFFYIATCHYDEHIVTLIIHVERWRRIGEGENDGDVTATCYFIDSNTTTFIENEVNLYSSNIQAEISECLRIPTFFLQHNPLEELNIGEENMFSYEGYCGVVAIIFINFMLQLLLDTEYFDSNIMKIGRQLELKIEKLYDLCISMKNTYADEENHLWFYVIKNCAIKTFLSFFELDENKTLKQQHSYLGIWNFSSIFDDLGYSLVKNADNWRYNIGHQKGKSQLNIRQLISSGQISTNYMKLAYRMLHSDCLPNFFGILLFDDDEQYTLNSIRNTIESIPVKDNRVKYYVINKDHRNYVFATGDSLCYDRWVNYILNEGMIVDFSSLSGKENLTMTKDGMLRNGKLYKNFHIIGINRLENIKKRKMYDDYKDVY